MERINPLTEAQLESLPQHLSGKPSAVRFLANGQCVNICTGIAKSKGSNVLYHTVYWDRPKEFLDAVVSCLSENNPNVKIRCDVCG